MFGKLPQRRTLAQRVKIDENATSRHPRMPVHPGHSGPVRITAKENASKTTATTRQVLGEVTMTAVNRKVSWIELSVLAS